MAHRARTFLRAVAYPGCPETPESRPPQTSPAPAGVFLRDKLLVNTAAAINSILRPSRLGCPNPKEGAAEMPDWLFDLAALVAMTLTAALALLT